MINTDTKPWYQQFWPWFLIALPSVVIVACLYTVYLTQHNPLSMVKKDYYQEGLTINKNIAELKKARELGLHVTIDIKDAKTIKLNLSAQQLFEVPTTLILQFNHPVDDSKDLSFTFHKVADDTFSADLLTEQQWQLLTIEKHWYIQLQSFIVQANGDQLVDWLLEGETKNSSIAHITLDASSG